MKKINRRGKQAGQLRSGLELRVRERLDELGIRYEYEEYALQYWKPVRNAMCFECEAATVYASRWYYPDFWLPDLGMFIEVKGKFGQVDRMKMRLVREAHPDEKILMVFDRDNLIGKKARTNTRYTDYCTKYGLDSCVLENLAEKLQ